MQKALPLIAVVLIIGLCVAVALETRTIMDLTQRLKAAEARLAANAEHAAPNPAEPGAAPAIPDGTTADIASVAQQSADGQSASGASKAPVPAGTEKKPAADFGSAMQKMFTDPSMKKVMRQQQSMAVRMMYGDLVKQLGLTQENADALMELLGDRQMDMTTKGLAMMGGKPGADDGKAIKDVSADYDAKLKALLGDDGLTQVKTYEKSIGDRMVMQQYQQLFASSSQPLEDNQRADLLQIMIDERAKSPKTAFDAGNKDVSAQMKALQSDQAIHDYMAAEGDFNQRVYERAAQVLSPEQLAQFQKYQQQLSDMQAAQFKMSRTMMKQ